MLSRTALLVIAFQAVASGQGMTTSPVRGASTVMTIGYDSSVRNVTLIMSPVSGIQGSCYVELRYAYPLGNHIALYDTSTGTPLNPQIGVPGPGSTWPTLVSNACEIQMSGSAFFSYGGAQLNITARGGLAGRVHVQANYYFMVCTQYCNWEYGTSTIGFWETGLTELNGPQLTGPAHGSVLQSRTETFSWNPVSGGSGTCVSIGSYFGGGNYYSGCPGGTSVTVPNLPNDGSTVYVRLSTTVEEEPRISDFSVRAIEESVKAVLNFPFAGSTLVPGTQAEFTWGDDKNAANFRVRIVGTKTNGQAQTLAELTTAGYRTAINVPTGFSRLRITVDTIFKGGGEASHSLEYLVLGGGESGPLAPDPRPTSPYCLPQVGPGLPLESDILTITWSPPYLPGGGVDPGARYYLEVGSGRVDEADLYPVAAEDRGVTFTATSKTISLVGKRDGRTLFVRLWWASSTKRLLTPSEPCRIKTSPMVLSFAPPPSAPAQFLWASGIVPASIPSRRASFSWDTGQGADAYWLRVGTAPGWGNLYNSYNDAFPLGLERTSATVDYIPSGVSTVYVTLFSRIGGYWYAPAYDQPFAVAQDGTGVIPQSFYTCLHSSGSPAVPVACTLPRGVYAVGGNFNSTSPLPPSASGLTVNAPITVRGKYLSIGGPNSGNTTYSSDPDVVFLRIGGCATTMHLGGTTNSAVSNVTIRDVAFDGNVESLADTCNVDTLAVGTALPGFQPNVWDLAIAGSGNSVAPDTAITVDRVHLRDAMSRSLVILGPGVDGVTVKNSVIRNAAVTGALVHATKQVNGADVRHTDCTSANYPTNGFPESTKNVTFDTVHFLENWTGALFNTNGYKFSVQGSHFINNYWNPYDSAGGTMGTSECTIDTKILSNVFIGGVLNGAGYVATLPTLTDALEIHSRKIEIANNLITWYPHEGIGLNSVEDAIIRNNQIWANGMAVTLPGGTSPTASGVLVWNRVTNIPHRTTKDIRIFENVFSKLSDPNNNFQKAGVRLAACPDGAGCSSNNMINIFLYSNTSAPLPSVPFCTSTTNTPSFASQLNPGYSVPPGETALGSPGRNPLDDHPSCPGQ